MIASATMSNGDTASKPAEGWWFFRVPDFVRPLLARAGGKTALVYLSLASHANSDWQSWPAVSTIVNETGLTERAVRYNLRRLEEAGAIVKDSHTRRTTTYTLSTGARICPPTNKRGARICRVGGTNLPGRGHGFAPERKSRTKPVNETKSGCAAVPIPICLDSESFRTKWEEWKAHRKEIRKTLTAGTAAKQLAKLAAWGQDLAIRSLDEAMEAGWTGFFEPRSKGQNGSPNRNVGQTTRIRNRGPIPDRHWHSAGAAPSQAASDCTEASPPVDGRS